MKWSELTWKERKQIYDTVRAENPNVSYLDIKQQFDNIPEYENGKDVINFVNESNANFVYRLNTPFRNTIDDWETQYISPYIGKPTIRDGWKYKSISTHKMVYGEPYGEPVVWPLVQEVNGKLIDFSRPPYHPWAALDNAEQTGDYIKFPTTDSAKWFTENYKNYYPSFENGKEGNPKLPVELGLTPGTPEYFARQQRISGKADVVQPEAHLTPAGLVKDAISFGENIKEGNYKDAAVDAALTLIPVGVRKAAKHLFKTSEVPARVDRESRSVKKKTEADYDSEFSEVLRRNRNIKEYEKEISQSINTAISSNPKVRKLYDTVDSEYGTNYTDAIKRIAMRDMTNRGKYVKYAELPDGIQGHTAGRNIDPEIGPTINNFTITLDPLQYIPGTANHELGHVADQLAGDATKNGYLDYLLDEFNVMDRKELLDKGIRISPQHQMYLFDPLEAKSHMQHLKRSMIQQGKLTDWTDPLTQDKIEAFLFDPRNNVNGMNKIQYNMYRDKSRFVDRMNHLVPVEYAVPLGISGFVNYNTDNNN